MTHPPIQIVDEDDKPIGEAGMFEAHDNGLIHRVVRVMVENSNGQILLQKRQASMRRWPNCWDNSAAGHVDAGEDYLTAAKRELEEELGVSGVELKQVDTYYAELEQSDVTLKRFNRLYRTSIDYTPKNIQPEEVSEIKWFSVDEVKRLAKKQPELFSDGLADVIARYY